MPIPKEDTCVHLGVYVKKYFSCYESSEVYEL